MAQPVTEWWKPEMVRPALTPRWGAEMPGTSGTSDCSVGVAERESGSSGLAGFSLVVCAIAARGHSGKEEHETAEWPERTGWRQARLLGAAAAGAWRDVQLGCKQAAQSGKQLVLLPGECTCSVFEGNSGFQRAAMSV